jgi:dCTP deaminase
MTMAPHDPPAPRPTTATRASTLAELTRPGIQPSQWIERALREGVVATRVDVTSTQIQPNSLDLRLSKRGWRLQCSMLPGEEGIEKKLERFGWHSFELGAEGMVLERNAVYLFRCEESLALPEGVSARANPKSSTGRLDVFTRLVTENGVAFDEVPDGYRGALYIEVVARSFPIVARAGDTLSQIRFQCGPSLLDDADLRTELEQEPMVIDRAGRPLDTRSLRLGQGLFLSVHLRGAQGDIVGYRARKTARPIDLASRDLPRERFWERVAWAKDEPVILEPDEFYIFASRELVRLPPHLCAEMVPFDAGSGEMRTHYAGFFDSGFGWAQGKSPAETAAAVVLEVRNHDVPFLIEDGHPLFRLVFFRNSEVPAKLYGQGMGSNYQTQRLKLAKQFK